ncbi:hypothetical protein G9A89_007423 [Geosiphon pyriformis]|nr:hypothetical protein G9A89_007423 [Geosiphon pyriformis]
MSEQEYQRITDFSSGCQLCGDKEVPTRIYWTVEIRCCKECLKKKVVSKQHLKKEWDLPQELIDSLPTMTQHDIFDDGEIYLWKSDISTVINEYLLLSVFAAQEWLYEISSQSKIIAQKTAERESWDKRRILCKILTENTKYKELLQKLFDSFGIDPNVFCYALQKSKDYKNFLDDIKMRPFGRRNWETIKRKLSNDINLILNDLHEKENLKELGGNDNWKDLCPAQERMKIGKVNDVE